MGILRDFVFFFKQKTAYEMRISDWSSDVCSSDLRSAVALIESRLARIERLNPRLNAFSEILAERARREAEAVDAMVAAGRDPGPLAGVPFGVKDNYDVAGRITTRSEEHTSELQSLMRISYAVFCLKKKNTTQKQAKAKQHMNVLRINSHKQELLYLLDRRYRHLKYKRGDITHTSGHTVKMYKLQPNTRSIVQSTYNE